MIIAVIGTTISPWMQFYIQAAVVDKGVRKQKYPMSRVDVGTGALFTDFIAYFIIVACAATIYVHNLIQFRSVKIFYGLYLALVVIGAGIVVIPGAPLLAIIFYSQVLNGVLLPVVLVLMLLLINNKHIMGTWTNGVFFNVIAWATVVIVAVLTLISTIQTIFPSLGS